MDGRADTKEEKVRNLHVLSGAILHGITDSSSGTRRSHMARCLGQLNDLFSRPFTVSGSAELKPSLDPFIAPVDMATIRSSTCRESMFLEHDAIRQQQRLQEIAAANEMGDEVELATTMRMHQKERNPFSGYVEPKLKRFVCCAYNGLRLPQGSVNVEANVDSYASINTDGHVFYRSPWSNLRQTVIDIPRLGMALLEEREPLPSAAGVPADDTNCPIVARYQREAMLLFSHEDLSLHRQNAEALSTFDRLAKAREVEVLLNKLLAGYLDAYYASAEEIANKKDKNAFFAAQDMVASALVKDTSFERSGQPRQYFLEVNAVIRNRTKTEEGQWETAVSKEQTADLTSARAGKRAPAFRSWTSVHTATVHQLKKDVKIAMASRLLIHQTNRKEAPPQSTPQGDSAHKSYAPEPQGSEDDDLEVDPIAIYGAPSNAKPAGLVLDVEASISNVSWASTVFQVPKDEDVLLVLPEGMAQLVGDCIQNAENDCLVPSLLNVLSSSTAEIISSTMKRRMAEPVAMDGTPSRPNVEDAEDDDNPERLLAIKLPTRLDNSHYHEAALEVAARAVGRVR